MKIVYAAILTPKESGHGYFCKVPDLPGCISTGKDLGDALTMITDAAHVWLCDGEDDRKNIPTPTPIHAIPHEANDICTLIQLDTEAYRRATDTKAVRKNVSIPAWMDRKVQQQGINCSQVLQDALRTLFS